MQGVCKTGILHKHNFRMPNFKVEITRRGTEREKVSIQILTSKGISYEKALSLLM